MKKSMLVFFTLFVTVPLWGQVKEIKMATIAPSGSSWDNFVVKMNDELKKRSGGRLSFKVYPGGTQGDERDVIRKMRTGQIHAGGFTGNGLGEILPQIRVIELPVLYQTAAEVDHVIQNFGPQVEAALLKGKPSVVLLGWAEAGFVYLYSKKPIRNVEDLRKTKAWLWEGDPLVSATYESLSVKPIPLAIPDVMTALSTNMVETVYTPPLGALALQWASKVHYMTDFPLALSVGGFVMLKSEFDKLSPAQQKLLKEITTRHCRDMVLQTRKDNQQAIQEMKRLGVQVISVGEKEKKEFSELVKKVWPRMVGKLYTQDQLNRVEQLISEVRSKGDSASAQLH